MAIIEGRKGNNKRNQTAQSNSIRRKVERRKQVEISQAAWRAKSLKEQLAELNKRPGLSERQQARLLRKLTRNMSC